MGATAEELPGRGRGRGQGLVPESEAEPFSPSFFLDLPPTPSEEDPAAASTDDLALPFISRMLMEEDIDDKFVYHYPDHPALLQAQQPYAQILSDAAAAASDCFTTNTNGSGACVFTPPSPDAPAFANATWPYDPAGLAQQLLPSLCPGMGAGTNDFTADGGNQLLLPRQDTGNNGEEFLDTAVEQAATTATCSLSRAGDGEHDVLASTFFDGRNMVDMDMINQAFHRGMEEAKKFLPIDETRGSKMSPTFRSPFECGDHFSCENEQIHVKFLRSKGAQTVEDTRNEENADGRLTYQGNGSGRGCKSRYNWQDLETERGRKSKLMVPEPEETGEMIDEIILTEYRLCLNGMLGLHITMDREDGKNMRKGNWKSVLGTQSSNETVYLQTLLIHCAQAVSMDDRWSATKLLWQIKQHSSPMGDANQRLAHYLAEGLEARLAGTGSQVYKSLMSTHTSLVEMLKAYQLYLTVCCFKMMAYKFSNMTIANVIVGRKKLHIVDYGILHGLQWPSLLGILSTWEGGPPEVRITGIDLPQPGFRPAAQIEETGRRLSKCAHQFGIPFKFQSIAAKWEMVSVDDLNLDPEEALIINGLFKFGNLMDEGSDVYSPSPRDLVLGNIRKMRPDVFIFSNSNLTHGTPFFVTRFREVLFYFSSMFDMLDATVPRDNEQRLMVERHFFRRSALNLIACEGSDRVERHEMYRQWQVRNQRAGLRQLPLDPGIVKAARKKVKDSYHKDFVIDVDQQWLLEGWKGRIICAMSTWVADDAFSEH